MLQKLKNMPQKKGWRRSFSRRQEWEKWPRINGGFMKSDDGLTNPLPLAVSALPSGKAS